MNDKSYQRNYDIFKDRVINAIGKKYLPIYRMADGEFNFILNLSKIPTINNILTLIGIKKNKTCWGENFTFWELEKIKVLYFKQLKIISQKGFLANHFIDFSDGKHHPYFKTFKSISKKFEKHNIIFNETNYTSFYYVYALLTGNDRELILRNKNILIITSFDEVKKANLLKFLVNDENASSVDFYKISATKSMFDKIDFKQLKPTYDLVLIGAGIGSSNILVQCEKLKTVSIDAGIVLERYANRELKYSRIFLL
ncbi:MAG TPA: hypothetical protein VIL99_09270 [Ignavibacteria bacterium]